MAEIIAKVKDLFTGELTEDDKLVYVNSVLKGKLLASELLSAIMGALDAHTSMSTQALNSIDVQRGLTDILLNCAGLYEALRAGRIT